MIPMKSVSISYKKEATYVLSLEVPGIWLTKHFPEKQVFAWG